MSNSYPLLLEQALDSWPLWGVPVLSRPLPLAELTGGLTNRSFRILMHTGAGKRFAVLRLNAPHPRSLGIDRRREAQILSCAAGQKLAPEVLFSDPDYRFLISAWVEGNQLRPKDLDSSLARQRLSQLIERIQTLDPDLPRFNYVEQVRRYWRLARQRHCGQADQLEPSYRQFVERLVEFQSGPWSPVLCHHDLTTENLIDTPAGLVALDWEYAALGHPGIDRARLALIDSADDADADLLRELLSWLDRLWVLARA